MTTTLATTAAELIARVTPAAVRGLPVTEALTPSTAAPGTEFAGAIVVPFTGQVSGELAVLVDDQIIASLPPASAGTPDLTTALSAAVDAIMDALGSVRAGIAQAIDARLVPHRIASHADSASVTLVGADQPRASVWIGVETRDSAGAGAAMTVTSDRLDLLRGVEMQASAELGRARMTINDLLSLRTGAVIELDRAAGDPADLFVNGRLIARGEVVVVDENYALRITEIVADEPGR